MDAEEKAEARKGLKGDWLKNFDEQVRQSDWEKALPKLSEGEAASLVRKYTDFVIMRGFVELLHRYGEEFVFDPRAELPDDLPPLLSTKIDDDGTTTIKLVNREDATDAWYDTVREAEWAGRDRQQMWSTTEEGLRSILNLPSKKGADEAEEEGNELPLDAREPESTTDEVAE